MTTPATPTRTEAINELKAILSVAAHEKRLTTEAERARLDELSDVLDATDPMLRPNSALRGGLNHGEHAVPVTPFLRSSDRLADHVSARADVGDEPMSLGRLIQAQVTGNRRILNDSEQRVLSLGTDSAGGFLTPEPLAAQVIDLARNASVALKAGVTTFPMASDKENLARLTGDATASWHAENAAIADSSPTFDRLTLNAKTLYSMVKLSRELFEDLSPEASAIIEESIAAQIGLALDQGILRGDGTSNAPTGILHTTGVGTVTNTTNGATLTSFDQYVATVGTVLAANENPTAAIYNARTAVQLAKFKDTTGQPLAAPALWGDLSKYVTNAIPSTLTVGTSSDGTEVYAGDFSKVILGVRPSLQVRALTLNEAFVSNLQVGLLVYLRADVVISRPAALTVMTGVRA